MEGQAEEIRGNRRALQRFPARRLLNRSVSQMCPQCHSRRSSISGIARYIESLQSPGGLNLLKTPFFAHIS
jgi:hypothetical protein